MAVNIKGSEMLTVEQTAKVLRVSCHTVYNLVKRGMLTPRREIEGNHQVLKFLAVDVYAAASAAIEPTDLAKVQNTASRALALAYHNQQSLAAVLELLGIAEPVLSFTEDGVSSLYVELQDAVERAEPLTEKEVVRWSRVLMQINEEYIDLVRKITADLEPWLLLLQLGERSEEDTRETTGDTIFATRAFLEGARRHFRNTAYWYVRTRGDKSLPYDKPLDEELISLMFHH